MTRWGENEIRFHCLSKAHLISRCSGVSVEFNPLFCSTSRMGALAWKAPSRNEDRYTAENDLTKLLAVSVQWLDSGAMRAKNKPSSPPPPPKPARPHVPPSQTYKST